LNRKAVSYFSKQRGDVMGALSGKLQKDTEERKNSSGNYGNMYVMQKN
jgi:hypothetical protein